MAKAVSCKDHVYYLRVFYVYFNRKEPPSGSVNKPLLLLLVVVVGVGAVVGVRVGGGGVGVGVVFFHVQFTHSHPFLALS